MKAQLHIRTHHGDLVPYTEGNFSNTTTLGKEVVEGETVRLHDIGGLMEEYEVVAVGMNTAVLVVKGKVACELCN
jgi:hypothetical protein